MIFRITKFIYILFIFKTFPYYPQTTFQIRENEYQHSHASAAFDIFRDYFSTSSSQYLFVLVYKIIVRVHKIIVRVYKIIILLALIIIKDRKFKDCQRIERLFYDDEIITLDERREEKKKDED